MLNGRAVIRTQPVGVHVEYVIVFRAATREHGTTLPSRDAGVPVSPGRALDAALRTVSSEVHPGRLACVALIEGDGDQVERLAYRGLSCPPGEFLDHVLRRAHGAVRSVTLTGELVELYSLDGEAVVELVVAMVSDVVTAYHLAAVP